MDLVCLHASLEDAGVSPKMRSMEIVLAPMTRARSYNFRDSSRVSTYSRHLDKRTNTSMEANCKSSS